MTLKLISKGAWQLKRNSRFRKNSITSFLSDLGTEPRGSCSEVALANTRSTIPEPYHEVIMAVFVSTLKFKCGVKLSMPLVSRHDKRQGTHFQVQHWYASNFTRVLKKRVKTRPRFNLLLIWYLTSRSITNEEHRIISCLAVILTQRITYNTWYTSLYTRTHIKINFKQNYIHSTFYWTPVL